MHAACIWHHAQLPAVFGLYALLGLTVKKKADGADCLFPAADNANDPLLLSMTISDLVWLWQQQCTAVGGPYCP